MSLVSADLSHVLTLTGYDSVYTGVHLRQLYNQTEASIAADLNRRRCGFR
jgi:hypothetical protein